MIKRLAVSVAVCTCQCHAWGRAGLGNWVQFVTELQWLWFTWYVRLERCVCVCVGVCVCVCVVFLLYNYATEMTLQFPHNGLNKVFCIKEAALAVRLIHWIRSVCPVAEHSVVFNHPHLFQREEIKIKLQIKMFVYSSSLFCTVSYTHLTLPTNHRV